MLDMNISRQWVGFLTAAGFECAHWSTTGTPDASDRDIFAFALANEYVLLTHDLDFSAMLAAMHGDKPSVVQIRAGDLSVSAIGKSVVIALTQMRSELDLGALLTIEPGRTRMRMLPLRRD